MWFITLESRWAALAILYIDAPISGGAARAASGEITKMSAGDSWMFENRMARVLAADYTPLSSVDIFVTDLGLVIDMARASKFS